MNLQEKIEFNKKQLMSIRPRAVDLSNLNDSLTKTDIQNMAENSGIWEESRGEIYRLMPQKVTGGVNPGDGRMLYHLIINSPVRSVFEVGTHIGISTIHILAALKHKRAPEFVTVDVRDVNGSEGAAARLGLSMNPWKMTQAMAPDVVTYVRSDSLEFMRSCDRKFDMIFLDGLHTAQQVCLELETAMGRLNKGGFIVLHDYFPNCEPLFAGIEPITGPYLGVEHFKKENKIRVIPLGDLPWATKNGQNTTSLAVVVR